MKNTDLKKGRMFELLQCLLLYQIHLLDFKVRYAVNKTILQTELKKKKKNRCYCSN